MQIEQMRAQTNMQIEQMKAESSANIEMQKKQYEGQLKMQENAAKEQIERYKADLDAATKIMVARISSNPGTDVPLIDASINSAEVISGRLGDDVRNAMDHISNVHNNMANMHGEAMGKLHEAVQSLSAPKRLIRGPDGRAIGVEVVR
jgi:hypothetical protein